jgi:acetoin utilization protein AcuB
MYSKAKDLMTKKLITIAAAAKLKEAAEVMNEHRIRHLPVVDDKDVIIGILSSKDLRTFPETKDISVEFFMSNPVIYVDQDLPLKQAIYKMLENKISCLIVSNVNDDAMGIITTDDLLWHLVTHLEQDPNNSAILEGFFSQDTVGKAVNQLSAMGI